MNSEEKNFQEIQEEERQLKRTLAERWSGNEDDNSPEARSNILFDSYDFLDMRI